jgi:hypothetical protein
MAREPASRAAAYERAIEPCISASSVREKNGRHLKFPQKGRNRLCCWTEDPLERESTTH